MVDLHHWWPLWDGALVCLGGAGGNMVRSVAFSGHGRHTAHTSPPPAPPYAIGAPRSAKLDADGQFGWCVLMLFARCLMDSTTHQAMSAGATPATKYLYRNRWLGLTRSQGPLMPTKFCILYLYVYLY